MGRWVQFDAVEALLNYEEVMDTISEVTKRDTSVSIENRKDDVLY